MNLIQETKFIMNKYGITANKNFGQNFLIDENVLETIVKCSEINKKDLIIEIGPRFGNTNLLSYTKSWKSNLHRT